MPLKLAVIGHPRFPIRSPFYGGLEAFIHALIEYYSSRYDVTLYAHPDSEIHVRLKSFPLDTSLYSRFPDLVENDFMLKVMSDIRQNGFDVIHNNAINSIPAVYACKHNMPIVNTLHTPPYSKLKASVELASFSPYVQFIAVSHTVAESWRPYVNDKIGVIHNGIDLDAWETGKTSPDYAFSFGRILPSKGFDLACKAARDLGLPFKLAGPIFDSEHFQKQIVPLLNDKIEYVGHLSHRQLQNRLACARVAIFGTRWDEPFGLSTVEAMATGTPVAAFNRGAFQEIVSSTGGVLASGNNLRSLTQAVEAAVNVSQDDVICRAHQFPLSRMCSSYTEILETMA